MVYEKKLLIFKINDKAVKNVSVMFSVCVFVGVKADCLTRDLGLWGHVFGIKLKEKRKYYITIKKIKFILFELKKKINNVFFPLKDTLFSVVVRFLSITFMNYIALLKILQSITHEIWRFFIFLFWHYVISIKY